MLHRRVVFGSRGRPGTLVTPTWGGSTIVDGGIGMDVLGRQAWHGNRLAPPAKPAVRQDNPLGGKLFRIIFSDLSGDVVPSASSSGPSHSGRGRIGPFAVILRPGLALNGVLPLLQDHVQKLVDAVPQTCRPGEHFPGPSALDPSRVVVVVIAARVYVLIHLLVGCQQRRRVGARVQEIAERALLLLVAPLGGTTVVLLPE